MIKQIALIILFLTVSCTPKTNKIRHDVSKTFDILVTSHNFDEISKKKILNGIVSKSRLSFDENSNTLILLDIAVHKNVLLLSKGNEVEREDTKYTINYILRDKAKNKVIKQGRFIIINDEQALSNSFMNYRISDHAINVLTSNLVLKLESTFN